MSTVIYHNHHIIPKHTGGTNAPDNIARLTVEEHTEAHRLLYEKYGRWQDKKAYEGLAGFKGKEEIIKEIQIQNGKNAKGRKHSEETKKQISKSVSGETNANHGKFGKDSYSYGMKRTLESRKKMSESAKKRPPVSAETIERMKASSAKERPWRRKVK